MYYNDIKEQKKKQTIIVNKKEHRWTDCKSLILIVRVTQHILGNSLIH